MDGDWRILRVCFRVSSAACPAVMAIGRVRSDSLRSLSRKALPFVPQTIVSLMGSLEDFRIQTQRLTFSLRQ